VLQADLRRFENLVLQEATKTVEDRSFDVLESAEEVLIDLHKTQFSPEPIRLFWTLIGTYSSK
jgi:hypothetical protein